MRTGDWVEGIPQSTVLRAGYAPRARLLTGSLRMGTLTSYLQQSFAAVCPPQWICQYEVALFGREIADVLGYAPRADVLLTRMEDNRRLWIEFEISRADPVANHAKFATGHLFHPVAPTDTFVAMVSPHVDRGRRNLAAATKIGRASCRERV